MCVLSLLMGQLKQQQQDSDDNTIQHLHVKMSTSRKHGPSALTESQSRSTSAHPAGVYALVVVGTRVIAVN